MASVGYNKLVRDGIPERIEEEGKHASIRTYEVGEFRLALTAKLVEEALEVQEASHSERLVIELADVLEVLQALTVASGVTFDQVERVRETRHYDRGGFSKRICLIAVDE